LSRPYSPRLPSSRIRARNIHADNSEVSVAGKIIGLFFPRKETTQSGHMAINVDQRRSMHSDQCAVFLRDASKLNMQHCTSFRAETQASDFLPVYSFFYYNLPIVEGKDGLFCLSFFFHFFSTRWGKPLIRKSPTNVRSNKRKKERHHGFDPVSVAKVL